MIIIFIIISTFDDMSYLAATCNCSCIHSQVTIKDLEILKDHQEKEVRTYMYCIHVAKNSYSFFGSIVT